MKGQSAFFKAVCALAVPAALQSMLQSSFSMVDQIMIGQLGVSPAVFRRRRWMDRLGIRTPDLLVRSQTLYPAELTAHICDAHLK